MSDKPTASKRREYHKPKIHRWDNPSPEVLEYLVGHPLESDTDEAPKGPATTEERQATEQTIVAKLKEFREEQVCPRENSPDRLQS